MWLRKKATEAPINLQEKINVLIQAIPCLLLIVIVIGGIIGGIFTATEGSVVAVVYSLLLSLFGYKSIKLKEIPQILKESAEMTGIIIFLIGVSSIMSWVMAFTNIPADRRYFYGYDAGLPDFYSDLPASVYRIRNEYDPLCL